MISNAEEGTFAHVFFSLQLAMSDMYLEKTTDLTDLRDLSNLCLTGGYSMLPHLVILIILPEDTPAQLIKNNLVKAPAAPRGATCSSA